MNHALTVFLLFIIQPLPEWDFTALVVEMLHHLADKVGHFYYCNPLSLFKFLVVELLRPFSIKHMRSVVYPKKRVCILVFLLFSPYFACNSTSGRRTNVCVSIDSPWR